jgi:hypothetical protein
MRNALVTASGELRRTGSELAMYACMLILRAALCLYGSMLSAMSCTIAIRYSAVRRQTAVPGTGGLVFFIFSNLIL